MRFVAECAALVEPEHRIAIGWEQVATTPRSEICVGGRVPNACTLVPEPQRVFGLDLVLAPRLLFLFSALAFALHHLREYFLAGSLAPWSFTAQRLNGV